MTTLSRSTSWFVTRTSLTILLLCFALFLVWTAGDLVGQAPAQQKPRVEEEEDAPKTKSQPGKRKRIEEEEEAPRKKPKRKVIVVPDEEEKNAKAKAPANRPGGEAVSGTLAKLAEQATEPTIKELFRSLAVPYDNVLYKRSTVTVNGERQQNEYKIKPYKIYLGKDPGRFRNELFKFVRLTQEMEPGGNVTIGPESLESVTPYEEVAQDKVKQFLRANTPAPSLGDPNPQPSYETYVAAGQALSAVLRWHQSARSIGERNQDDEWKKVEANLSKYLLDDVFLKQMKLLAGAKDWERVLELVRRLARTYTDPKERESILKPVADMITRDFNDPTSGEDRRRQALQRLAELEKEFPDNEAFKPLGDTFRLHAEGYLKSATALAEAKNFQRAKEELLKARNLWPKLEGLRELESRLNLERPTLRVGVRGPLPKYFSPAWACTENERRAVDMLFESLVKLVPDAAGGYRYGRGLSESNPRVASLGRQFELPRRTFWSDGMPLTSTDLVSTLNLVQAGKGVGRSRVWGDLILDAERKRDPFQVTLHLRQGFLDTLAPMNFKILPRDRQVNTEEFARKPVTSGPFRLEGERSDERKELCLFFVANPDYAIRPTKHNEPHIQEIRFYTYHSDAVQEFSSRNFDLLLDLTTKEVEKLAAEHTAGRLPIEVPLPTRTAPNRRIYFLAINTTRLTDPVLRQAISCAIDREALLDKHLRPHLQAPFHKALNGPFPVGSWACNPEMKNPANRASSRLFDKEAAQLLKEQPAVREAAKATARDPWKIRFPDDDPALREVMKDLCAQVKELTGVVLEPSPCTPYQLREDVEGSKSYALAYYHYDFPDESYWLAPLFGPPPGAAENDNKNIFKYQNADFSTLLALTKSYRDFATVKKHQWETHELFNREMPFIPLWQLDPLLAYRSEVQPTALDPLSVFSNIEEWHLLRK